MKKSIIGLLMLSIAGFVNAAAIYQEDTIATSNTNFSESLMFDKFDDMGGSLTLESVLISFSGVLDGSVGAESLDEQATTITTLITASLTLDGDLGVLLDMSPGSFVNSFNATAYDGTLDLAGTSGFFVDDIGGSVDSEATFTDAGTLDYFTGDDTVSILFNALAESSATGPGNIYSEFSMFAGGTISVVYNSVATNVVNAPSLVALFLAGGILLVRRKQRS